MACLKKHSRAVEEGSVKDMPGARGFSKGSGGNGGVLRKMEAWRHLGWKRRLAEDISL